MKKILTLVILILFMLPLSGCSISNEMDSYRPVTDVNNLDGRRIGVIAAWAEDYILSKRDDLTLLRYDDTSSVLMALAYKKIDAAAFDAPTVAYLLNTVEGIEVLKPHIDETGMVYTCPNEEIRNEFNEFLIHYKTTDQFKKIQSQINDYNYSSNYIVDTSEPKKFPGARTIRVAMDDSYYPISFMDIKTRTAQGYDKSILKDFAEYKGYNIEFVLGTYTSNEQLLRSGKVDFMCEGSTILEKYDYELAGIYCTDSIYIDDMCLLSLSENEKMKYKDIREVENE